MENYLVLLFEYLNYDKDCEEIKTLKKLDEYILSQRHCGCLVDFFNLYSLKILSKLVDGFYNRDMKINTIRNNACVIISLINENNMEKALLYYLICAIIIHNY